MVTGIDLLSLLCKTLKFIGLSSKVFFLDLLNLIRFVVVGLGAGPRCSQELVFNNGHSS